MKRLGLRGRIRLALVALVAITCAVLTFAAIGALSRAHEDNLDRTLMTDLRLDTIALIGAVQQRPAARTADELAVTWPEATAPSQRALIALDALGELPRRDRIVPYRFFEARSSVVEGVEHCLAWGDGGSLGWLVPTLSDHAFGSSASWRKDCGDHAFGFSFTPTLGEPGAPAGWVLVHALDRTQFGDPTPILRTELLLASGIALLPTLLLASLLADMITQPLARARESADRVASGDLGVRLPVEGIDEVAGMSAAVNAMADQLTAQIDDLERANQAQRRFVADVAHELRTPTAALLASAESLAHVETRDEASALVIPQLRRLAGLTEDLLEISRMDAGRAVVVPSRVDLVDLVREVLDETGRPGDVTLDAPAWLPVELDPARTRVVVRNLVANALQHGTPPVRVAVSVAGEWVEVSVTDAGPGVPDDLRERVFDRFVRGDAARHGPSTGLGLAIAHENARLLGGTLELGPAASQFTLRVPLSPPDA